MSNRLSERLVRTIRERLQSRPSTELNAILEKRDHEEWSPEAFEAIAKIIDDRSRTGFEPVAEAEESSIADDTAPDVARPVYAMIGVQDRLEVYAEKVCITPKGVLGFVNKGLKGTKTIPYFSVSAVQFREAGPVFSGYLQFTIPGGNENRGGLLAATKDENTFLFARRQNNALAIKIKNYVERAIHAARAPTGQPSLSLPDEVKKLADLRASGILSDAEFHAAKTKLLG